MPRPLSRPAALFAAALLTICFVGWLSIGQSQAVGLWQADSPPGTPSVPETPTETPVSQQDAPTPTPTEIVSETPTDIPTDTPVPPPDLPTETPTDTPIPTETPTPEPTATPLPTGTPTPTPRPTPRPVLLPTPTPEPTILDVAGQVMNVILTSAFWIWITCGSLLFFAVAGAIAGFSFYRNSRRRFDLYEIVPEDEGNAPSVGPKRGGSAPAEDDSWPSSLP